MTLGVIGYGNMGQAIVRRVAKQKLFDEVMVYDVLESKLVKLPQKVVVASLEEIAQADVVLLAIKPQDVKAFLDGYKHLFASRSKPFVTIVAGLSVEWYRNWLRCPIARVMPNTPAQIGKGASVIYFDGDFSSEMKEVVRGIFGSLGIVEEVAKEDLLHAVTGLSGSGPAYIFVLLSALADAGVMEGLSRNVAKRLAVQTVLGSAVLALEALEEGKSFEDLKDMVMSPAGTTARGVFALEEAGFRAAVIRAVREATLRSRELGGK